MAFTSAGLEKAAACTQQTVSIGQRSSSILETFVPLRFEKASAYMFILRRLRCATTSCPMRHGKGLALLCRTRSSTSPQTYGLLSPPFCSPFNLSTIWPPYLTSDCLTGYEFCVGIPSTFENTRKSRNFSSPTAKFL